MGAFLTMADGRCYNAHNIEAIRHKVKGQRFSRGERRLNGYELLNIPSTATRDEIRAAYRELARRWHPDRFLPVNADQAKDAMTDEAFTALFGRMVERGVL